MPDGRLPGVLGPLVSACTCVWHEHIVQSSSPESDRSLALAWQECSPGAAAVAEW
jgi:hypothetical protein